MDDFASKIYLDDAVLAQQQVIIIVKVKLLQP